MWINISMYLGGVIVDVLHRDDARGVGGEAVAPEPSCGDGQVEMRALCRLEVDQLGVPDADEAVVAVDLEGARLVAAQESVDDPLSPAVGSNGADLRHVLAGRWVLPHGGPVHALLEVWLME